MTVVGASPIIRLHAADNVVVAGRKLEPGTRIEAENVTCLAAIPAGHKLATRAIKAGEAVRKYDQIIGFASEPIAAGAHVHTHNCLMGAFERDYAFGADARPTAFVPEAERAMFDGIVRADGRAHDRQGV